MLAQEEQGEGGLIHDQHSTSSPKMTRASESPGLTTCWRRSVDVEEGHRGSCGGESDAEEHVSRDTHETERFQRTMG